MNELLKWMSNLDQPNIEYRWHSANKLIAPKIHGCQLVLSVTIFRDENTSDTIVRVFVGDQSNDIIVFVSDGDASKNLFPVEEQSWYSFETGEWEQIEI